MSNLTIKLNDEEDKELDSLKYYLNEKTSSKAIKCAVKNHIKIKKEIENKKYEIESLKNELKNTKYEIQKYFETMQNLMKISEYEQKL